MKEIKYKEMKFNPSNFIGDPCGTTTPCMWER